VPSPDTHILVVIVTDDIPPVIDACRDPTEIGIVNEAILGAPIEDTKFKSFSSKSLRELKSLLVNSMYIYSVS